MDLLFLLIFYYPLFISIATIIYSSFISLFIVDIKSIIAYSTISQLAYILLSLFIISFISLSHIYIHAFYKCLLFILAAEIIYNIHPNWQSIYNFYINNLLIRCYFLLAGIALLFASSKEGILHAMLYFSIISYCYLLFSSILSLYYIFFILFFIILFFDHRLLLSFSIFAFILLSFIIFFADKSFHSCISILDYPHSFPYYNIYYISSLAIILLFDYLLLYLDHH